MAPSRSSSKFRPLAEFVRARVEDGLIPGAVVAAGSRGKLVYHAAHGWRSLRPRRERMTLTTIFDLASLKVMATAPVLVEHATRGAFSLLDPVERHLPEMAGSEAGRTPIHRLLTHTAGFVPDNPLPDYAGESARSSRRSRGSRSPRSPARASPTATWATSWRRGWPSGGCGGGWTSWRTSSCSSRYASATRASARGGRTAAASRRPSGADGSWLRGAVHDPRARTRALEGIGGHAGMFGTAREVARFCEMIPRRGQLGRKRILSEATVRAMTTDQCEGNLGVRRGFGFDIESAYSAPRGASSREAFDTAGGRASRSGSTRRWTPTWCSSRTRSTPTATRISRRSAPKPRRSRRGAIRRR